VRLTYSIALIGWSLFAGLQGIARGFVSLFGFRLGLGLLETPCFPANSRILATWFPQDERARANSVYAVGQYVGTAFLSVPLVWVISQFGWRNLFFIVAGLGVVFGLYWYGKYHEPQDSKFANDAELQYIGAGGGLAAKTPRVQFSFAAAWKLAKQRQIITASLAQFCSNTVLVFFLLDFVNYLGKERHMEFLKAGIWAAFPYMAAALGVICGGQVSDRLLKKTGSANLGRKVPIVVGLLMASSLVLADFVPADQNGLVIAIMSVALFGQGICNLGWTVISDVAPKSVIGLTGGIFNFITNLAGILTPIIIGYVLKFTNTYTAALFYVSAMPLIGAFLYVFVLGDIKRLSAD
jgi:ACS family D-galactonate transporter-like MFS transporter